MTPASRQKLIDSLYVGLLVLYVLAGMMLTPFHGDEATIIYMSKDWYLLTVQHDLPQVLYREGITDPRLSNDQEFRLENGVISKYAIGVAWTLAGLTIHDITDPWFWGADYNDNQAHGHIPTPAMRFAARLSSTLMLALSVAIVFAISKQLGGRSTAWIGAFVYATLPALLLNSRRAMFEGATALAITLILLAGVGIARRLQRGDGARSLWIGWLWFGAASGFCIGAKHSLLLVIAAIGVMLLILSWRNLLRTVGYAFVAGLLALTIFMAINPAWWSQPLRMPAYVAGLRAGILKVQVDIFGGWTNNGDRITALVRYPFGEAQYFEDKADWAAWIGTQIAAYSQSPWGGIVWDRFGIVVYPLLAVGVIALLWVRKPPQILFLGTLILTVGQVFVLTPLPWQRYYLLLAAPWSVTLGIGVTACWRFAVNYRRKALRPV
ncbi:MAG: phospholipid carrier-dependent glycosyltransferase [Chloroflexota bacterium]